MIKKFILVIIYISLAQFVNATPIDDMSKTVVYLRKYTQKTITVDGKPAKLFYIKADSEKFMPYLETNSGTGFVIKYNGRDYIVTAKHVAEMLSREGEVLFNGPNGKLYNISLKLLSNSKIIKGARWFHHPKVDISIHPIAYPSKEIDVLSIPEDLYPKKVDVNVKLLGTVYILGFPLSLGALDNLSPVAKEAKIASKLTSIINMNVRKDVYFYLLDEALSQGYSGSPVFYLEDVMSNAIMMGDRPLLKAGDKVSLLGVQSIAISDVTGGKMSAIVPIFYIWDILESDDFKKYQESLKVN